LNKLGAKMKSILPSFLAVSLVLVTLQVQAEVITRVKAAELACHRVDRLVVLKKIDKTYLSKFHRLDLVELGANDPSGGKFTVTVYQTTPTHGFPFNLQVQLDESGKVIKHQTSDGGTAGPDVTWSGKDPVSLVEAGLHYVIEEYVRNDQLRPFAIDFKSLTLGQKLVNGVTVAELAMKSDTTTAKLILTLDLNGKLLNKQVMP
jgi:hypothetical protein